MSTQHYEGLQVFVPNDVRDYLTNLQHQIAGDVCDKNRSHFQASSTGYNSSKLRNCYQCLSNLKNAFYRTKAINNWHGATKLFKTLLN